MANGAVLSKVGGHLCILASLLLGAHVGWAGDWVFHVAETLKDLGRALGSSLLQLWGTDQDRTAELADIVAAKRHVLGDIEPDKRLVCRNFKGRYVVRPLTRSQGSRQISADHACRCRRRTDRPVGGYVCPRPQRGLEGGCAGSLAAATGCGGHRWCHHALDWSCEDP